MRVVASKRLVYLPNLTLNHYESMKGKVEQLSGNWWYIVEYGYQVDAEMYGIKDNRLSEAL